MTFDNILTTVLTGLFWVLLAILVYELLRLAGRAVARKRARLVEPETYGDDGGRPTATDLQQATIRPTAVEQQRHSRPKAPETGSGLHVVTEVADELPDIPKFLQRKTGD